MRRAAYRLEKVMRNRMTNQDMVEVELDMDDI